MMKTLIDDTITFTLALAFMMPWTALSVAHDTTMRAVVVASTGDIVNVASASDFTSHDEPLQKEGDGGTVAAFVKVAQDALLSVVLE